MTTLPSTSRSRRIARTEVRRTVRSLRGNTTQVAALAVAVLVFGLFVLAGANLARLAGQSLASGEDYGSPVLPTVRGVAALAWVGAAFVVAGRTVGGRGDVDQPETLLLAARVSDVVAGYVLAEATFVFVWAGGLAGVVVAGFALGAGTPVPLVALAVALAAVLATAVPAGYAAGLVVRHVITRFEPIARHKGALGALAFVTYFAMLVTGTVSVVFRTLFSLLRDSPLGWHGDLLALGSPGLAPSFLAAAGGVVLALVGAPLAFLAAARVASVHWFSDPARPDADDGGRAADDPAGPGFAAGALASLGSRPTTAVTRVAWTRTRRAPIKLLYVAYPLFGVASVLSDVYETGQVPEYLPVLALLYGAWGAGVAFTLNPLGDQGSVLPATLTTPVEGREFVLGHVLAAVVVGVPVAVVLTGGTALLSPLGPVVALGLVGASVVAVAATAVLAAGVGAAFPRFGAVRVTRNREAVVPSKRAFLAYSLVLFVGAGSAVVTFNEELRLAAAVVLSLLLPFDATIAPGALRPVTGLLTMLALVSPALAYAHAVSRFERFTLDEREAGTSSLRDRLPWR